MQTEISFYDKIDLETIILFLGTFIIIAIASFWQQAKDNTFDLKYLVIDPTTERVSLSKFGQIVALMFSSWVLIHETRYGRLSEWLFTSYMLAWAGANLLGKWLDKKSNSQEPK